MKTFLGETVLENIANALSGEGRTILVDDITKSNVTTIWVRDEDTIVGIVLLEKARDN